MTAGLIVLAGRMPARDANGRSTIGRLRVYENETTTPVSVYSSSALSTALSQPISSDSAGQFPLIWIDDANTPVTVAYEDDSGQTQTYDGVTASTAAAAAIVNAYAGAVSFEFSTTTTDADPGAGKVRFDNATIASVTNVYIDNTSLAGGSVTGWIDSFDDANTTTNRGTIAFRSLTDTSVFVLLKVTGAVTDGTGYRKIPVAYLSGSLPANATELVMGFASAGPASAATVTVGTTTAGATTASPSVTNSGSSSAAVLDFVIPRGAPGGVLYTFSTTTTDSDPGAGKVRFNNATPASITAAYFDNADANGNTVTGWLDTFDDSTNTVKGSLTIRELATGLVMTFNVTGSVVDGTGYRKLTLVHTAGSTLFTNDAELSVEFVRAGNVGANGTGSGDVSGPASATANAVALYDGTTGKLLKDGPSYGTSGANKLLQLDSSGKLPAVDGSQLTGISAGLTLLATVTASSSATVDIEGYFDSTYDEYLLLADGIYPTANASLQMLFKVSGSYQTSGYIFAYAYRDSNSTSETLATATTEVPLSTLWNLTSGFEGAVEVRLYRPASSSTAKLFTAKSFQPQNSYVTKYEGFGKYGTGTQAAITGVRFLFSSGNVSTGTFRLYGFKK
ncbi:MAG: hypothetical protein LCH78_18135 [Proteobacteria bacterium]|nr:hypothetical protein [Pseudomonadota bacterium]